MFNRFLAFVLAAFFALGGYVAFVSVTLPNVRLALKNGVEPVQTSRLYGRDNTLIMAYGKYQHKPVPLAEMPPMLIKALLSTEDRRFYQHHGVDPIGVARAIVANVRSHGVQEGGSTLTQQLARNIFLTNERSIQRKLKEALLALKLEQQLTKDQILEMYLNNVYFGEGAYGVAAASSIYFGKTPRQLTDAECAMLAGMPQAPSLYSPFSNPELAEKRRNEVLENLVENHEMEQGRAEVLAHHRFRLNPEGRAVSSADRAPFFNRMVINQAMDMMDMDEQTFWNQGLRIYTTLDPRAQRVAAIQVRSLSNAFGRTGANQQAALVSLDENGGMIAYVGGKDFGVSQFDRAIQAKRLAGSLFKVFVYATAMEKGISPVTVYKDAPVTFGDWTPHNYDKSHHGFMTLAQAFAHSNNIIAIKLLNDVTPNAVISTAQRLGIKAAMQPNLSLALGAADVTLMDMTTAFSVFMNNGEYVEPYAIEKIMDRDGRILYQHTPNRHKVMERPARDTMVQLMKGVVRYGTAKGANIGREAAGKTGTSDDYRDAWFIGFTPTVTTGVWVGNDNNRPMPGITGGSLPARIWRAYMSRLLSGTPQRTFDVTQGTPIEEKDFYVYNLENLSQTEAENAKTEGPEGEVPADTPANPEGGTERTVSPEGTTEGAPADGSAPAPQPAPQGPQAPVAPTSPTNSGAGGDRFFDFNKPSGNSGRYMAPSAEPVKPPVKQPASAGQ